jgi:hypothetical protein
MQKAAAKITPGITKTNSIFLPRQFSLNGMKNLNTVSSVVAPIGTPPRIASTSSCLSLSKKGALQRNRRGVVYALAFATRQALVVLPVQWNSK